jgi:hypothetical protein
MVPFQVQQGSIRQPPGADTPGDAIAAPALDLYRLLATRFRGRMPDAGA